MILFLEFILEKEVQEQVILGGSGGGGSYRKGRPSAFGEDKYQGLAALGNGGAGGGSGNASLSGGGNPLGGTGGLLIIFSKDISKMGNLESIGSVPEMAFGTSGGSSGSRFY